VRIRRVLNRCSAGRAKSRSAWYLRPTIFAIHTGSSLFIRPQAKNTAGFSLRVLAFYTSYTSFIIAYLCTPCHGFAAIPVKFVEICMKKPVDLFRPTGSFFIFAFALFRPAKGGGNNTNLVVLNSQHTSAALCRADGALTVGHPAVALAQSRHIVHVIGHDANIAADGTKRNLFRISIIKQTVCCDNLKVE
jgi:hypothetical protein